MKQISFGDLSLGVIFKYREDDEREYVKVGMNGEIALWDSEQKFNGWIGQQVMSLNDDNDMGQLVYVDEERNR